MEDVQGDGSSRKGTGGVVEPRSDADSDVDAGRESSSEVEVRAGARERGRAAQEKLTMAQWRSEVERIFKERPTFTDLGGRLVTLLRLAPTALGKFIRQWSDPMRPPPTDEVTYERKGDLLPIHPCCVKVGRNGVTEETEQWVKATLCVLNFHYCTGWTKAICVPMDTRLGSNQKRSLEALSRTVAGNMCSARQTPPFSEAKRTLDSKRFDYAGNPVEHMLELKAELVIPTWPKKGEAGVVSIEQFLQGEVLEAIRDPQSWVLPLDKQPLRTRKSTVRATDQEWEKICRAGAERGMFTWVTEDSVPRDRSGHLVTNGAGGVRKVKVVNGKEVELQRFISILVPSNEIVGMLPGEQDSLPYIGQLTALFLEKDEELMLESEDFQSAFNLFRVPPAWSPLFAYSKKVHGRVFGRPDLGMVRPALQVVPMGWKSAVTLVQAAVRNIVYERVGVPRETSVRKDQEIPQGDFLSVVYLDNYDEIRILKKVQAELEEVDRAPTATHQRFNEVCGELGLPLNLGKQLIRAWSGAMQGGEFDGRAGVLKLGRDKLESFTGMTLALLRQSLVGEFALRHWVGKAAFAAAFRRPLFAVLQEIFGVIEASKAGGQRELPAAVVDEILSFMILAPHAQSELRAELSVEISCTDASPYGGGSAVAQKFKEKSLVVPEPRAPREVCGGCGQVFEGRDASFRVYGCPLRCGEKFCSAWCLAEHTESQCQRRGFYCPVFGERFSGPNYPLTKACGLAGIAVQKPLDRLCAAEPWDALSPAGKDRLEAMERSASLKATHWGPECRTFSRARGRWIRVRSGWIPGPPQVRSSEEPWGFSHLPPSQQVAVRQGNTMLRQTIRGLKERDRAGGFASFEHPWNSFAWDVPEIRELVRTDGWFVSCYSHCCYGGMREKWTGLLHNSVRIHAAVHRPECPGHPWTQSYEVHETSEGLAFDTSEEAEYPWGFCLAYAEGLLRQLRETTPAPFGNFPVSLESLIYAQVRGATRGLQDERFVNHVVQAVTHTLGNMEAGQEVAHLYHLMRQVGLRGTDVRLRVPDADIDREVVYPYPAFRWLWRTVLSYKWAASQHINVLEVTAVLVEFRRRLRSEENMGKRFMNIVDSLVTFYAITKGRSGSKKLNRPLRRIMALNIASKSVIMSLWTLSKWNFADAASRRFDPKK